MDLMGVRTPPPDKVNCTPNVIAEKSAARHDEVPRAHLTDRLQGAPFLVSRYTLQCPSSQTGKGPSAIRQIFREAPFDFSTESTEPVELDFEGRRQFPDFVEK